MSESGWLSRETVHWEYSEEQRLTRWVFCHGVDPTRNPHPVALELVAELYNIPRSAFEGILRCRICGQRYYHEYQEINNWDSSGEDHPMVYDDWYPVSAEEAEALYWDRRPELSPRLYLRLGL